MNDSVGWIIGNLLKMSELIYIYGSIRRILFKHDKRLKNSRGRKKGELDDDSKYLVEFESFDLVRELFETEQFDDIRFLKKPIRAAQYLEFLRRNRKYFIQTPDGRMEFNFQYGSDDSSDLELPYEKMVDTFTKADGRLLDLDDENTLEGGLVYGIFSSRLKRSGCVVFRGTVGGTDFPTNANFVHNDQVFTYKSCNFPGVKVHSGFASYLFDKNGEGQSKYDRIIGCLKYFYETIPDDLKDDYKLYVTGHSLGGALSSLFAFAAAHGEKDHPVFQKIRVVTFGSPVVGNMEYNKAFQNCERSGRISLLRISNEGDVICTRPLPGYTQNGVNMHLMPNGERMELQYRNTKDLLTQVCSDPATRHSFPDYEQKLFSSVHSEILGRSYEEVMRIGGNFTK
eukprot:CAMPEP_0194272262 /NCGR_PEP_ID=MMETSP0169-20130528/5874_1 /TAXON_ID=218684 /ORGANISM="Corethron pennatum, Strain L29A3" /LENGTH=397 /DNA_ID=CAMNT_0039014877 /DNA_START=203 /DNA_END=1396 /DNA_ORIENTATION=+